MLIYIKGEGWKHFTVRHISQNFFGLNIRPNRYMITYDDSKILFYGEEEYSCYFSIKDNKIVLYSLNVYLCEKNKELFLSESSKHSVKFKITKSDIKYLDFGTYSYIYENFMDDDKDYYNRVSYLKYYKFLQEDIKHTMKDYFLIPEVVKVGNGIVVEKVIKGISFTNFKKENYLLKYKKIIDAISHMNKNNIVHSDISLQNIVELNYEFFLIDIDSTIRTTDDLKTNIISMKYIYTVPSFVTKTLMKEFNIELVDCTNNNNKIILELSNEYNSILDLFRNVVEKDYETPMYTVEQVLHYLNIFQSLMPFLILSWGFGEYNDKLYDFFKKCLDTQNLISTDDFVELYKATFL